MTLQAPLPPPAGYNEAWRQIRLMLSQLQAQLQPFYPSPVTGNTTIDPTYGFYLVDASGGAVTLTLPKAQAHKGRCFSVKKIDASGNAVTIDGDGSETIDDSTTAAITVQYVCLTVMSDGSEWWIV